MRNVVCVLPYLLLLLVSWLGQAAAASVSEVHYVMGTYLTVTIDGTEPSVSRQWMRKCFAEVRRLDAIFSRYAADSELNRINAGGGQSATPVSYDVARLLRLSLALQKASGGRFDVSIGALTEPPLGSPLVPVPKAGAPEVRISPAACGRADGACGATVRLDRAAQLDFDGIAKGYAVDRCAAILRGGGVRRALINFGESSQYAIGAPEGAAGWPVELRSLDPERIAARLRLRDEALSVSAALVERGGAVHSHILDPRNGMPLTLPAMAAVVAGSGAVAEAWSKALLLPGPDGPEPGASRASRFRGALRITPGGIERLGRIHAALPRQPEPLSAVAEVLR